MKTPAAVEGDLTVPEGAAPRSPGRVGNLLVVEDTKSAREALVDGLVSEGHSVFAAANGERALEVLEQERVDLVLCDLMLPGMDGISFLRRVRALSPHCAVVIMTGFASVDSAVLAMREGAYDYIRKPLRLKEVRHTVDKALENRALRLEVGSLREQLKDRFGEGSIVGSSSSLRRALEVAQQVAPSRSTVLVTGESGTGKELLANAIHFSSLRADREFVKVNCAALPETLLEAELFGHEKGAFTGAVRQREGRFLRADGGTLFLDEIGDLSPPTQAKILRVLQEGEFEMVGGSRTLKVDVRIIAATNLDLRAAIAEKKFREDLFYRLNVISIRLPALRERKEDIPLLVYHFLRKFGQENQKPVEGITERALERLKTRSWPGNLRELENAVEHAVVMARQSVIDIDDLPELPPEDRAAAAPDADVLTFPVGTPIEEMEIEAIRRTLEHYRGDKEATAERLGISIATLYRKLKKLSEPDLPEE